MTFMLVALAGWVADCGILGVCYLFDDTPWRTVLTVGRTVAFIAALFIEASAPDARTSLDPTAAR